MDRSKLLILIPAFNEEETIFHIVSSSLKYGDVLVVNDASTDSTEIKAFQAGAKVIKHDQNLGYDQALNSGFSYASKMGYKYLITLDADRQHPTEKIVSIKNKLLEGADIVVSYRHKKQRIAEYIFSFYTRLKWGIKDPLSGFKGYKVKVYDELGHFDSYNSIGTELTLFAAKNSKLIRQIPIITSDRIDNPRFGNSLKSNYKIILAMLKSIAK